jgi:hypothetical protein
MLWMTHNNVTKAVTASSQQLQFPASNLGSLLACDVWRSGVVLATETLACVFDRAYTSADAPFYLVLQGHNFDTTCTSVTYTLTHTTGSEPAVNVPYVAGQPVLKAVTLTAGKSYLSMTLTFNKSAANKSVQVGKAYIGPAFDAGAVDEPAPGGVDRQYAELINADKAVLGQRFAEPRASFWAATLQIPYVTEAVQTTLRSIFRLVGTHTPFFLVMEKAAAGAGEFDTPRFCHLVNPPAEKLIGPGGSGLLWGVSLALEEQL